MTAETVVKLKNLGWKIAIGGAKALGYTGAGILIGAAMAGIDLGPIKGPAKLATALGALGLADACGEVASKQIEKRAIEVRAIAVVGEDFGEKFAKNLEEIKKKTEEAVEQQKAEAQAAAT